MKSKTILLTILTVGLLSFVSGDKNTIEFNYPKDKTATVTMTTDMFKKFNKEWRGTDYYYSANNKDGFICSVLFYKLNADEVKQFVDFPRQLMSGPETSPAYPQTYFSIYSPTKKIETNEQKWGDVSSDFMFRQTDIKEFEGKKVNQKNMFAYAMFGTDLFLNIHLSKENCSASDSTAMREILDGLKKKK
jgi:hypothetical protein